jgi:hypothetical protein
MMPPALHLAAGQVALIEPEEFGPHGWRWADPVSGVVDNVDDDLVTIGVAAADLIDGSEVMVSVFAPDALYRIRAQARWIGAERVALDPIHDVECIQRRRWPRHVLHLDVTLAPLIPEGGTIAGRTLDIGIGGLRVETEAALGEATHVTVTLMLPDGVPLVARATVIATADHDGRFEHRLAFDQLDDLDVTNLAALLDPHATAADIRRKAAHGG